MRYASWEGEGNRRLAVQTLAAAEPLTLPSPRRGEEKLCED